MAPKNHLSRNLIILSLTHQKRGVYEALETKEWDLAVVTSLFGFRIWLIECKLQISRRNCDIPCLTISYFWIHGVVMLMQTANIKTKFVWHKCRSNQSLKPEWSESVAHLLKGSGWRNPSEKKQSNAYWSKFLQSTHTYGSDFPGREKWSKCGIFFYFFFEALLWPYSLIFSTFLNCFEEILKMFSFWS